MTSLDPNHVEELRASEARYWETLQTTLVLVFGTDPDLATHYQRSLLKTSPLQRALALHDEPLDVASALTGQSLTAHHFALYDAIMSPSPEAKSFVREIPKVARPHDVLSSAPRDERTPMVKVATLNKFMGELGYHRLAVSSGVAYFLLERKAWKRPLPRRFDMETLPGVNADREDVYGLDRILNVLNGLQEFVRRRKRASSIIERIEKIKARLIRTLG